MKNISISEKILKRAKERVAKRKAKFHPPPSEVSTRLKHLLEIQIKTAEEKTDFTPADVSDTSIDENTRKAIKVELFKAKRKAAVTHLKDIETYIGAFNKSFKKELSREKDQWPKKWMTKNKGIMESLSLKRNRFVIPLLNYLWKNRQDCKACEDILVEKDTPHYDEMEIKQGKNKGQIIYRPHTFIKPIDYKRTSNRLGMSPDLIRKHMREFVRCEILGELGKDGPRGQMLYFIGYYSPFKGGKWRTFPFLKDSPEMRHALLQFNPYGTK